ncbi:hypothetical protein P3342_004923 [Pyrenophora teres f. teres]|nr:hypothetical protein P3342_004923 [Pyrenophora teres f. teres]
MEDNLPNLNADELSAYASAKYLAGVPDDQIYQEIVQMLRNDGWKEAAIAPMINEEPPKVPQDPTAAIMAQLVQLLSPITARLEAIERREPSPAPQTFTPKFRSEPDKPALQESRARTKYPHPELFDGDRSKYSAFRYKVKAKLYNDYQGATDRSKVAYVPTAKRTVRDYHMEFNRLELQSGIQVGETQKKSMFCKGLHVEIQKALVFVNGDLSFEQFAREATRVSDHLYRVGLTTRARQGHTPAEQSTPKRWMDHQDVSIAPAKRSLFIHSRGIRVRCDEGIATRSATHQVSASTFIGLIRRSKDPKKRVQIFAASITDINKALAPKKAVDVRSLLPKQYQSYFELFNPKEASKLPPHRGPGVDHKIELESKDGQQPQPPWGPLYRFIRVSSSPASSPVLFAKKPGGGLRLCIDYRALNAITRKDRYPLPLIRETLNNISKAKWFTKLDVIAAFHKIRVAEGDEWKTAFRTRFGLFEWLVTPFGMANSPSTFQRYINWTLREYLDEFCSAYLDDVLIYTDGSLRQHQDHVRKVLSKLQSAGLHVDIKKCEFEVKSTKYLGFIIDAGKGISIDPDKVKAIKEWEAPKTVKGVRSFLGFANFYRKFIRDFAKIATPLTRLTGDVSFTWGKDEQAAFDKLKEIFVIEPVLATFDSERDTVLECDSSGYATGGVLSQYDEEGKNNAHECNYEIHDKELLAVVRCLEEWDAELRSVKSFKVITDHKNLEYFMKPKMLSERQIRWAASLSRFNMEILYRPGKQNDLPEDAGDERLQKRIVQILKPTSRCYEEASEDEEDSGKSWVMSARIRVRRTGSCPSLTENSQINKTPPPTRAVQTS